MPYNPTDLIDKAILIANKQIDIYTQVINKKFYDFRIRTLANVFIKHINDNIEYYEAIKENCRECLEEEIDFSVYDKISFLVNSFYKNIIMPNINSAKELTKYHLEMEEKKYALFIDMQGRFVKSNADRKTYGYKIISDIIKNKEKHINEIKKVMNR